MININRYLLFVSMVTPLITLILYLYVYFTNKKITLTSMLLHQLLIKKKKEKQLLIYLLNNF